MLTARPTSAARWLWALVLVVTLLCVGQGDVASALSGSVTRTAPYDEGNSYGGCSRNCEVSWAADKTTGDLAASVRVESAPVEEQLLWPTFYRYWSGYSQGFVSALVAAGPGTTTWTARLHIFSAVVEEAASSGSAGASLSVGFGVSDTSRPYGGLVAGTSKVLESMSNGDVVLQFQVPLPAAGLYEATASVWASALVTNEDVANTPSVPLPCLISQRLGREHRICVPPSVPSQTAHGVADGHATASVAARLDSISVVAS